MFGKLGLMAVFIGCANAVSAQIELKQASFKLGFADSSYSRFFNDYPLYKLITIYYDDGKPGIITLNTSNNAETFDLRFEGDRYWLSKKYPRLLIPPQPTVDASYIANSGNAQRTSMNGQICAELTRDSVIYRLYYYDRSNSYVEPSTFNLRPGYLGNQQELQKFVSQIYRSRQPATVGDSVFLFEGIVERSGALSNVTLLAGEKSAFTEELIKTLPKNATQWRPALQGGTPVRSEAKIYIKINPDQSLLVSTSR